MGGYLKDEFESPQNELARKTFENLITPYVARQLANNNPEKVVFFFSFFCTKGFFPPNLC